VNLPQPASYQVARLGATIFVRATGLANMKNAPMLDLFLQSEIEQDAKLVCIDLSVCAGMDSTFMGVLVGYAQLLGARGGKLVVVNPSEGNLRLLDMLGVSAVLPVLQRVERADLEFVNLPASPTLGPMQRMELVRRAHHHLVAISDDNRAKFAAFIQALEADLARVQNQGTQGRPPSGH
jgi:anti-anti-sigma factor